MVDKSKQENAHGRNPGATTRALQGEVKEG